MQGTDNKETEMELIGSLLVLAIVIWIITKIILMVTKSMRKIHDSIFS